MAARVYITGAAGSGTSSLGRALAESLGVPHLDTDDFYWAPSDPPFTLKRPVPERLSLLAQAVGPDGGWVLSGSADSWGDGFIAGADLIVFLVTPTPVRLMRIRKREVAKFGNRVREGGDMHRNHGSFLTWAASYDDPYFGGRSLQRHRNWLAGQAAPVLELSGARPVAELAQECLSRLG